MTRVDVEIPSYGQLTPLASDVYWARFALPFRLNHINLYILDGGDSWTVIDSGLKDDATADHWAELLAGPLAGKPVTRIITTHHHVDHIGYVGPLAQQTGATVYSSEDEIAHAHWLYDHEADDFARLMENVYTAHGFDADTIGVARADPGRYRRHVAPLPAIETLAEGDVITSRDGEWQVRVDAGHSSGHISLYDKGRDIYLAVDFLLPRISPNVSADLRKLDHDQLGPYLEYLSAIRGVITPSTLVLPGHDWPFTDGPARAAELTRHHHQRLDQLRAAAARGPLTTAAALDVLFGRVFGPHEVYFAAGEARAHLNHLVTRGEFMRSRSDGVDWFEVTS